MTDDAVNHAELDSLSTSLDDLARRLSGFADEASAAKRDDIANELFEIERSLTTAARRLARLVKQ